MMLTGAATKLESQFRLKWNMILNLLRVEDMYEQYYSSTGVLVVVVIEEVVVSDGPAVDAKEEWTPGLTRSL